MCYLISVSLEGVDYLHTPERFWKSFGREIATALGDPTVVISSQREFLDAFVAKSGGSGQGNESVIILLDEFSELFKALDDIRNEVIRAMRWIKQSYDTFTISTIIFAGTFSIVHMNPTDRNISPHNISDALQSPNFSKEETERLFNDFARDEGITMDDMVVSDIWEISNGCVIGILPGIPYLTSLRSHPGMVCLCGRLVSNRLSSLLDQNSNDLPYRKWKSIPVEVLYGEINDYNTFHSIIASLCHPNPQAAVQLLRSRFAGFLGNVNIQFDAELADFLTAEGVFLKPDTAVSQYRMASHLIDGLTRTRVIPIQFPNAPSTVPPIQSDRNKLSILHTRSSH